MNECTIFRNMGKDVKRDREKKLPKWVIQNYKWLQIENDI